MEDLAFITQMPKVELHLHLEGTLEPELMFKMARRNSIDIPYANVDEVKLAYKFGSLGAFLDLYYLGARVLCTEEDFYELTMAYLTKAHENNVRHVEPFFDPQVHLERGVSFQTFKSGMKRAFDEAKEKWGITVAPIMCFIRDKTEEEAMAVLKEALANHREFFCTVGLDSMERGNPPSKFARVFEEARKHSLRVTAHAGEEGPAEYVLEALDILKADRIDHGIHCIDDPVLCERLKREKICLTICPISNILLGVFPTMEEHNIKELMDQDLLVCVNSDDPAYFSSYINDNYIQIVEKHNLTREHILKLGRNAVLGSFLDEEGKEALLKEIDEHAKKFSINC